MKAFLKVIVKAISLTGIIGLFIVGCGMKTQPTVLHVAIPFSDTVKDIDNNYYINWLEKKTGYDIDVTFIYNSRADEFLSMFFNSEANIDIVMLGGEGMADEKLLDKYVESGEIYAPDGVMKYTGYAERELDGAAQILWINYEWLDKLGMSMPKTTDELEAVLKAFKENDLNGNGMQDEIPLIGSSEDYKYNPAELLLESFIYNDPYHSRYGIGTEKDVLYASSDKFREGLKYCNRLYSEGLLDSRIYSYTLKEMCEIINSPESIVGAFTTDSISSVVYKGNPEIMARYMHVPPLTGPDGTSNAMYAPKEAQTAAIILQRSTKKEEATKLLDLMMTEEASLIARFGEPGVDWDYATGQDVSIYGTSATIVTKNYIWDTLQNKHLNGTGPMNVPEKYLRGVTWNGINSDAEYTDARAQMSYQERLPEEARKDCEFHEYDTRLSNYIDGFISDFITGNRDIGSDSEWVEYLTGIK